ncbi:MAG: hypothetical protein JOZ31_12930 [Verrucomicrobia bacterium]|nr:hypothetical protein [Verrucomicrobiota bacterium]
MSERLLPLVRPIYETQGEIADARRAISESPDLQRQLDHQIQFDDQIVTALQTIALTDQQIERLENLLVENPPPESVEAPPVPDPVIPPVEATPAPGPILLQVPAAVAPTVVPEILTPPERPPSEAKEEAKTEQTATPADAKEAGEEEEEKEEEPPRARAVTIMAAVGIGIIATIALVAYMVWDQMANGFSGRDQVAELLETANTLSRDEFEAVNTTTANLKDWFFLKSDMHWFAVPKEFADTPTLGCRLSKFKGVDIGEILAKDDREVLMFLFHPADLGVKIRKGKWAIVDGENWEAGVTAVEDCCFIVAFKGKHSDMQEYLNKKVKK